MAEKLRLKESTYILKESEDVYQVIFTSTRVVRRFKVDQLVKDVISGLKEEHQRARLTERLSSKYDLPDVESCLASLEKFGVLVKQNTELPLNPRYERQVAFIAELTNSWEEAISLQSKLEGSTISIFGVGGIGTWMVNGFYQIGIGHLRIADPDVIHESNLNRQLFFTSKDIGKYKVDVVADKLPDANLQTSKKKVSEEVNLEEIISGSDFLVNCADSPSVADTTRIISRYAKKFGIPYMVTGGYNMHLGMVGPIIIPGKTACFDCFLESQKIRDSIRKLEVIKDIEQTGSLGPIAGVVSNFQVMDVFKFLVEKGSVNLNRFAEIDFMNLSIDWREFKKREGCDCC